MSPWAGVGVAVATIVATTACLALLRPVLASWRVVDLPNHRSSHTQPTVRGGGIGIVAGLLLGLGLSVWVLTGAGFGVVNIAAVGLAVGGLSVVGFAEDVRGLRVGVRLISQVLVIAIIVAVFHVVTEFPPAVGLLAGLAGVYYVNAANFMDGVNGISALHGAVVGGYFAVVGHLRDDLGLVLAGMTVGVAFLSFLPWNSPRARMFMGDVGSYALGGAAWALAVWALGVGVPLFTAVAPLLVYSADVAVTLVRRAMRGEALTQAHRDHVYQQVQRITQSHGKAAALVTGGTLACAAAGLWSLLLPSATLWATASAAALLVLLLATPSSLARRRLQTRRSDGVLE